MNKIGRLELDIRLGDERMPATASVVLKDLSAPTGRFKLTADCASADELEGQINALQDELDELRRQAHRAFKVGV